MQGIPLKPLVITIFTPLPVPILINFKFPFPPSLRFMPFKSIRQKKRAAHKGDWLRKALGQAVTHHQGLWARL